MKKSIVKEMASRAFNYGYGTIKNSNIDVLNARFDEWFEEEFNDLLNNKKIKKPILGIVPAKLFYEERMVSLLNAINRHIDADKQIPVEYVYEYNTLSSLVEKNNIE